MLSWRKLVSLAAVFFWGGALRDIQKTAARETRRKCSGQLFRSLSSSSLLLCSPGRKVSWKGCWLVPRPHYSARPMRFGSPGPSEFFSVVCPSRLRHRNALNEKAWWDAVQGLCKEGGSLHNRRFMSQATEANAAFRAKCCVCLAWLLVRLFCRLGRRRCSLSFHGPIRFLFFHGKMDLFWGRRRRLFSNQSDLKSRR